MLVRSKPVLLECVGPRSALNDFTDCGVNTVEKLTDLAAPPLAAVAAGTRFLV